jgi:hypothetical protein
MVDHGNPIQVESWVSRMEGSDIQSRKESGIPTVLLENATKWNVKDRAGRSGLSIQADNDRISHFNIVEGNVTVAPSLEKFVGTEAKSQLGMDYPTRINKNGGFASWFDRTDVEISWPFKTHKYGDFRSAIE